MRHTKKEKNMTHRKKEIKTVPKEARITVLRQTKILINGLTYSQRTKGNHEQRNKGTQKNHISIENINR